MIAGEVKGSNLRNSEEPRLDSVMLTDLAKDLYAAALGPDRVNTQIVPTPA